MKLKREPAGYSNGKPVDRLVLVDDDVDDDDRFVTTKQRVWRGFLITFGLGAAGGALAASAVWWLLL